MERVDLVREQVTSFFAKHAIGNTAADAFPAWWLARHFGLAPNDAVKACSDGPNDFGIDAYHIRELADRGPELHLVQAKFSSSVQQVRSAITGFERTMREIHPLLAGAPSETPKANPLWLHLAAHLERLGSQRSKLRLHFTVLHLVPQAQEVLQHALRATRDEFSDLAANHLAEWTVGPLSLVGPDSLDPSDEPIHVPGAARKLRFVGAELPSTTPVKYFAGMGYLSDLVELYEEYEDRLFSKNVRMYLYDKAEKGPAKYMRDTLKAICVDASPKSLPVERFTFFHNGITVQAQSAGTLVDGTIEVRSPSVLNGCQSVKNAYLFLNDKNLKHRVDKVLWREIRVPMRILVTTDDELVRQVAVGNNRQSEIRPSAFWANDPAQLRLAQRFADNKVFYERQEGAFQNLALSHAQRIEDEYTNSPTAPLKMEELAQAVAAARNKPALSTAGKVSELFHESYYKSVFEPTANAPIELLIFLRNLLKVCPLAVKDMKAHAAALRDISTNGFGYVAMRALSRYIVVEKPELVVAHGQEVLGRVAPNTELRAVASKLLGSHHTRLQQLIPELWYDQGEQTRNAHDRGAVDAALKRMKLDAVDVFEAYRGDE